jgi:hypothetical protein
LGLSQQTAFLIPSSIKYSVLVKIKRCLHKAMELHGSGDKPPLINPDTIWRYELSFAPQSPYPGETCFHYTLKRRMGAITQAVFVAALLLLLLLSSSSSEKTEVAGPVTSQSPWCARLSVNCSLVELYLLTPTRRSVKGATVNGVT